MITLATYTNELEAKLLESQLRSSGVDCKINRDDTHGGFATSDTFVIQVFEDDLDLAQEILEAKALDDDGAIGFDTDTEADFDLDELPDM